MTVRPEHDRDVQLPIFSLPLDGTFLRCPAPRLLLPLTFSLLCFLCAPYFFFFFFYFSPTLGGLRTFDSFVGEPRRPAHRRHTVPSLPGGQPGWPPLQSATEPDHRADQLGASCLLQTTAATGAATADTMEASGVAASLVEPPTVPPCTVPSLTPVASIASAAVLTA